MLFLNFLFMLLCVHVYEFLCVFSLSLSLSVIVRQVSTELKSFGLSSLSVPYTQPISIPMY